jgi:hypothetical protein
MRIFCRIIFCAKASGGEVCRPETQSLTELGAISLDRLHCANAGLRQRHGVHAQRQGDRSQAHNNNSFPSHFLIPCLDTTRALHFGAFRPAAIDTCQPKTATAM